MIRFRMERAMASVMMRAEPIFSQSDPVMTHSGYGSVKPDRVMAILK